MIDISNNERNYLDERLKLLGSSLQDKIEAIRTDETPLISTYKFKEHYQPSGGGGLYKATFTIKEGEGTLAKWFGKKIVRLKATGFRSLNNAKAIIYDESVREVIENNLHSLNKEFDMSFQIAK
jgi:hypothetical protein